MKKYPSFAGVHTALVTPFLKGQIDESAFTKLIKRQISAGINGIVPVGTTGESPTLSHKEQLRLIELAVQTAAKKTLVIAGTGSNSTAKTVETTVAAEKIGADAALIVVPYYNKPSPEGVYLHFKAVADAVKIPLVLYSVPGRSIIDIPICVVERLVKDCPNIVAIKECGGKVERVQELKGLMPNELEILSGDDPLTLPFLEAGAVGVISVASNLIPEEILKLVNLYQSGHSQEAEALHHYLAPLFRDLFIETNPVPVKTALAKLGLMEKELRLPLTQLTQENLSQLVKTLELFSL